MLLENGTYRASVKDISMYLRGEQDRLTAALKLECEGKELVHREWLELNDGTISDRAIRRLRQCFPKWDGSVESLEQGFCVRDVEVDVTIENEQDRQDPEKWWTRTKYIDPPGGGGGAASLPERENRTTLVSKYGSRFRALSGGNPKAESFNHKSTRIQPTPFVAMADKLATNGDRASGDVGGIPASSAARDSAHAASNGDAGPPSRPVAAVATSTMEDCWEAMCAKHPDELREQVGERWFSLLEGVHPGKDQAAFGPADWGRVMGEIGRP